MVSRLVGAKGLEEAVSIARALGVKLKVVGESYGYVNIKKKVTHSRGDSSLVKFLGRVSDEELVRLYAGAKSLWALARDEDFGMTVVEAMAAGTPVVAYRGGGFVETVNKDTGVFVDEINPGAMQSALELIEEKTWDRKVLQARAREFSRERFERGIRTVVGT